MRFPADGPMRDPLGDKKRSISKFTDTRKKCPIEVLRNWKTVLPKGLESVHNSCPSVFLKNGTRNSDISMVFEFPEKSFEGN